MKTFIVNIESQTVTINGQSCNFYEAGLTDNSDPVTALTDRAEIIEVLQDREEEDEITVIFEGEKLADTLMNEIQNATPSFRTEPDVIMFLDQSSIFWVSKDGHFVWMGEHGGINPYLDSNHEIVTEKTPEGVGHEGVYWNNWDFESPYHISDFISKIETINV